MTDSLSVVVVTTDKKSPPSEIVSTSSGVKARLYNMTSSIDPFRSCPESRRPPIDSGVSFCCNSPEA